MQDEHTRAKQIQLLAWIVIFAKILGTLSAVSRSAAPPIKKFYVTLRTIDALVSILVLISVYFPKVSRSILIRSFLILYLTVPYVLEAVFSYPMQGGIFAWAVMVGGLAILFLFDPVQERGSALFSMFLIGSIAIIGILLQPYLKWIPPNPIAESPVRYVILVAVGGVASYFVFLRLGKVLRETMQLAERERALSSQREALLTELESEKERLTETLGEVQRLQLEEQRRAQREATLARYEALMRESYTASVSDFLQKLLDRFAEELPMLGGVIYMRCAEGWRVESAYALRQYLGQTYPGGTLTTAANLKSPYLISPAPAGTVKIRTSVATLTPKAILYLPFYSEATSETLAVAELLLSAPIPAEKEALLELLLPRIGTYLWARQGSLSLPTGAVQ